MINPLSGFRRILKASIPGWLIAIVVAGGAVIPFLGVPQASAVGQLASRSLAISSGVPSNPNTTYVFTFTPVATSTVQGLKFQACTTAVGTCNPPAGLSFSSATYVTQNLWQGAVNFAVDNTGAGDCTPSATILCANRTSAANQTATSRSITFSTITNPSTPNVAFFIHITTYSDAAYTLANIQDQGTTASAVVQTLEADAAVAEVLNFCVGSTAGDTGTATMPADCTAVSGTNVDLGVLSPSKVNVTPVSSGNGGDGDNGLVMLRTNASSGASVSYDAIQSSLGSGNVGTLRVNTASTTCSGVSLTDPCINAIGSSHTAIVANTEDFGMTVAAVDCNSTTSYICAFGSGNYNLVRTTNYNGTGGNTYPTDTDQVSGTTNAAYAWDQSGTSQIIASSTTFVDDEALILKFAATPANTTPYGAYSVSTDFIAVATY